MQAGLTARGGEHGDGGRRRQQIAVLKWPAPETLEHPDSSGEAQHRRPAWMLAPAAEDRNGPNRSQAGDGPAQHDRGALQKPPETQHEVEGREWSGAGEKIGQKQEDSGREQRYKPSAIVSGRQQSTGGHPNERDGDSPTVGGDGCEREYCEPDGIARLSALPKSSERGRRGKCQEGQEDVGHHRRDAHLNERARKESDSREACEDRVLVAPGPDKNKRRNARGQHRQP